MSYRENTKPYEPDGDRWMEIDLEKMLPDDIAIPLPDGRTVRKADLLAAEEGVTMEPPLPK